MVIQFIRDLALRFSLACYTRKLIFWHDRENYELYRLLSLRCFLLRHANESSCRESFQSTRYGTQHAALTYGKIEPSRKGGEIQQTLIYNFLLKLFNIIHSPFCSLHPRWSSLIRIYILQYFLDKQCPWTKTKQLLEPSNWKTHP